MSIRKKKTKSKARDGIYKRNIKRPMDLVLAFTAIILLSPLLITVAVLVKVQLGSPVLFRQKRPGLNERLFTLYKFRTMTEERDRKGELLPDFERLTRLGKFLRETSLDELPELWNILCGDMSFVGPRPVLVKDMMFMTAKQRQRYSVCPGLTGWAQVNGRNNITWEEKLSLDLEYIKRISFIWDCKILLMTIAKVLRKDDVNTEGMDTAEDLGDYLLREGKITSIEYRLGLAKSKKLLKKYKTKHQ